MVDEFNNKSLTHGCYNYIKFKWDNEFFLTSFCHFPKKIPKKGYSDTKSLKKNHHKTLKNLKICQELQLPAT